MKLSVLFVVVIMVIALQAQTIESGSLVMLRCDKGDGSKLLDAPSQINLNDLQVCFNSRVDTLVFVHGFNTSFDGANSSFATTVNLLKSSLGDKNYVGFYWPSDTWLSFGDAVENANKTGPYLVYVLATISRWYGSSNMKIHVVSHSLGARVVLSTLKENEARYVKWGNYFNMAAGVHANVYFTSFAGTNLHPIKTWVYHSKNDWVLKYLYALYYWLFDRAQFEGSREYRQWQSLRLSEKIQYMRQLETSVKAGALPGNEFDRALYQRIEEADAEAMGLIGAKLGDPVSIAKVENIDVSNEVDGHSYWNNGKIMERIAAVVRTRSEVVEEYNMD